MEYIRKYYLKTENKYFDTRLDIKLYLGHRRFNKLLKSGDILIINYNSLADYELQKNNGTSVRETQF